MLFIWEGWKKRKKKNHIACVAILSWSLKHHPIDKYEMNYETAGCLRVFKAEPIVFAGQFTEEF